MLRHFLRPAWFEIFVLRLPKLIWTFPIADPEAHFGHFPGRGSKMMAFWCVLVLNVYRRHFSALNLARKCTLWDSWSSFLVPFKYYLIHGPWKINVLECCQRCLIAIPYVCKFCPIELDAKKVHGCVHTSSSPPCAGPTGLWFDMLCSCMLCFIVAPCILCTGSR